MALLADAGEPRGTIKINTLHSAPFCSAPLCSTSLHSVAAASISDRYGSASGPSDISFFARSKLA
eukprot:9486752-Pyramimonas_sp.AAC.1